MFLANLAVLLIGVVCPALVIPFFVWYMWWEVYRGEGAKWYKPPANRRS